VRSVMVAREMRDRWRVRFALRAAAVASGRTPPADLPPMHPAQAQVHSERRRFNVVCNARRWGKTELSKRLLAETALAGQPAAYFALTYPNLVETWDGLKVALRAQTARVRESLHRLDLWSGGSITMWSLAAPVGLRGRKLARVVVDEAAHVEDLEYTWEYVVQPTLLDLQGDAWFLSTPNGFNYFHALWKRGQHDDADGGRWHDWMSWQMPTSTNPTIPNLDAELARLQGSLAPEVFMQEYEAQFVSDATQIFLPDWWAGRNRYDQDDLAEHPTRIQGRYIFWDTALKDKDTNAYSARVVAEVTYSDDPQADGLLLVREVWRGRPQFPALTDEIAESARAWNYDGKLERVVVEDKASGTSAVQTLRATAPRWLADRISAFEPSGSKAERWNKAAVWCKRGCVRLPLPDDRASWRREFEDELYAVPFAQFKDQADAFSELIIYLEHLLEGGWRRRADAPPSEEAA
jgi:phage terminase large subunit-like protein